MDGTGGKKSLGFDQVMKKEQTRTAKVLVVLMASMTVGGVVLLTLDNHVPARGAYSLASYLRLDPIEKVTLQSVKTDRMQWTGIEVFYSGTSQGNLTEMFKIGRTGYHFLVCNSNGAEDGQIEFTPSWSSQKYVAAMNGVIRICVIADLDKSPATGSQFKRTSALIDSLTRNFGVAPEKVRYPTNWQL
jgi:hypothetical protein